MNRLAPAENEENRTVAGVTSGQRVGLASTNKTAGPEGPATLIDAVLYGVSADF